MQSQVRSYSMAALHPCLLSWVLQCVELTGSGVELSCDTAELDTLRDTMQRLGQLAPQSVRADQPVIIEILALGQKMGTRWTHLTNPAFSPTAFHRFVMV